jgi:broad specificity phosphatase PhoE
VPSESVTTICLVRHGETDWNVARRYQGWSDIPLNTVGVAQAELVARVIAEEPAWHAIVSSPLSRAMQTAQAIAEATGLRPIAEDPDLRERGYGFAEGMTASEREARWPGEDWPELEPYETMSGRAMGAMERIAARHEGQRVLVVSHGGLMNAVLGVTSNGIHGRGITVIHNTARTIVLRNRTGWAVSVVTDASHLEITIP